ncbi:hypothetical protein [Amycolatopsis sp. NPDC051372]|uniref:hypothetical protein n=1 Tax=unclassified Amycolatopsis TaxID=2618356 RepID=UPI0034233D36
MGDAVVVGGGIGGLTTAIGWRVTVLERAACAIAKAVRPAARFSLHLPASLPPRLSPSTPTP